MNHNNEHKPALFRKHVMKWKMKSNHCIAPALGRSVLTSGTIESTAIQSTTIVSYTGYYWAYYWSKDSTSYVTETYTISSISSISIAKALLPIQCISRDSQQGCIIQKKSNQYYLPERADLRQKSGQNTLEECSELKIGATF